MSTIEKPQFNLNQSIEPVVFQPYDGAIATIIPRDDSRVVEALLLEAEVMTLLGDPGIKNELEERAPSSGFIIVSDLPTGKMLGAIRYMLPTEGQNKSFEDVALQRGIPVKDVEELFYDQSGNYDGFTVAPARSVAQTIDASSLSPDMKDVDRAVIAQRADLLLATCRIVGQALFEDGNKTHTTANLHRIFYNHGDGIGYPFKMLLDNEGREITQFEGVDAPFVPAHSSLEHYADLMQRAEPGSHLDIVRSHYKNLSSHDVRRISSAMINAAA